MTQVKIRLTQPVAASDPVLPAHFLDPAGAAVILGGLGDAELPTAIAPTASSLFGPRGVCLAAETGPLWVADTGHHRLLGWQTCPQSDRQPADWVIGQLDFQQEGQNAKGNPHSASLSVPTGICLCGAGLAVADAWNHRILIWDTLPQDHNVPADRVLGQANFHSGEPNRGQFDTDADRLHWCYGVLYHAGKLLVADTGNRRILIWNQPPSENGQPADVVLGQPDFRSRNENGGGSPTARSMRWCHSMAIWQGNLVVADAGNNRILIWNGIPTDSNAPCAAVLGQPDFEQVELNQGQYLPSAKSLNMPYGVTVIGDWLLVADTANSRLLGWQGRSDLKALQNAPADLLIGQFDSQSKGENRFYGLPMRDSLCWPYAVQAVGNTLAIADSGNNRILLWRWP